MSWRAATPPEDCWGASQVWRIGLTPHLPPPQEASEQQQQGSEEVSLHLSHRTSWSDEVLCRMLFKDLTSEELLSNRKLKNSCNAVSPLQVILLQSDLTSAWTAAVGGSLSFLLLSMLGSTFISDASAPSSSVTLWLLLSAWWASTSPFAAGQLYSEEPGSSQRFRKGLGTGPLWSGFWILFSDVCFALFAQKQFVFFLLTVCIAHR